MENMKANKKPQVFTPLLKILKHPTIPLIPKHPQNSINASTPKETVSLPKQWIEEELPDHVSNLSDENSSSQRSGEKSPKQGSPSHEVKGYGPSLPPPSNAESNKKV